jgi:hypothetical protein
MFNKKLAYIIYSIVFAGFLLPGIVSAADCCVYYKTGSSVPASAIDLKDKECAPFGGYTVKKVADKDKTCSEGKANLEKANKEQYDAAKKGVTDAGKAVGEAAKKLNDSLPPTSDILNSEQAAYVEELNQLGKGTTLQQLIGRVIKAAMGLIGTIAFAMFVIAGIMMMLGAKGGDKNDINKAKGFLIWTIAGMFVIFASYAIVDLLFDPFDSSSSSALESKGECECVSNGEVSVISNADQAQCTELKEQGCKWQVIAPAGSKK